MTRPAGTNAARVAAVSLARIATNNFSTTAVTGSVATVCATAPPAYMSASSASLYMADQCRGRRQRELYRIDVSVIQGFFVYVVSAGFSRAFRGPGSFGQAGRQSEGPRPHYDNWW